MKTAAQVRLEKKDKHVNELNEARTRLVRMRSQRDELALAKARGEVIERRLIERQAAYLLLCLRQKILNFPSTYCRRAVGLKDTTSAKRILTQIAHGFLLELRDMPNKITNPHWMRELEKAEADPSE
jgi:hypothetical protein